MALCLITILVRQAPISRVAPRVFVAESAIFWNVSKKDPNANIVFLWIRSFIKGIPFAVSMGWRTRLSLISFNNLSIGIFHTFKWRGRKFDLQEEVGGRAVGGYGQKSSDVAPPSCQVDFSKNRFHLNFTAECSEHISLLLDAWQLGWVDMLTVQIMKYPRRVDVKMSERLLFKIPHSSHLMPKGVFCSLRTDKGSLRWIIESWLQKTIAAAAIARYRTQHNFYNTVFLRA